MLDINHTAIQVQLVALPLVAWGLERLVESAQPQIRLVGSAATVAECLLTIHLHKPDVLLLDLDGEDGTESLTELHSHTKGRILALTRSQDAALHDQAVLAGARGVVGMWEKPATLLKAIDRVHQGEMWIDRDATSRIFMELARKKAAQATDPAQQRIASLTRREHQTIVSLANDASASGKVAAERLHISERTLRNHLTSIYSKLALTNRVDLYAFAQKHGLSNSR